MSSSSTSSLVTLRRFASWENEQTLLPFTSPSFSEAAYIQQAIRENATGTRLDALSKLVEEISHEIRKQVTFHHEDLLAQTGRIVEIEKRLATAALRIENLKNGIKRIRVSLVNPVLRIEQNVRQLENINAAVHLARRCIRFQNVVKTLRKVLSPGQTPKLRDLAKAATCCCQLNVMASEVKGVVALDRHAVFIESCDALVRTQAASTLEKGVETMNQTDIGGALQVFFNLGPDELVTRVQGVVRGLVDECAAAMRICLSSSSSSSSSSLGKTAANGANGHSSNNNSDKSELPLRMAIWESLSDLSDKLSRVALQLRALDDTLKTKQEATVAVSFADIVQAHSDCSSSSSSSSSVSVMDGKTVKMADPLVLQETSSLPQWFWLHMCAALKDVMQRAFDVKQKKKRTPLTLLLIEQYPKLISVFRSLYSNFATNLMGVKATVARDGEAQSAEYASAVDRMIRSQICRQTLGPDSWLALNACLQPYESEYLARCFEALNQPVHLMFDSQAAYRNVPSRTDVSSLVSAIKHTLVPLSYDIPHLSLKVIKSICQTVIAFVTHCEAMVKPNATYVAAFSQNPSNVSSSNFASFLSKNMKTNAEVFLIVAHLRRKLKKENFATLLPVEREVDGETEEKQHDSKSNLSSRSVAAAEQAGYRAHVGAIVWRELKRALDSLSNLANHIIEVLINGTELAMTSAILNMHHEAPVSASYAQTTKPVYLRKLGNQVNVFLLVCNKMYVPYCKETGLAFQPFLVKLMRRLTTTFIRSSCMMTLNEATKLRTTQHIGNFTEIMRMMLPELRKDEVKEDAYDARSLVDSAYLHALGAFKDLMFVELKTEHDVPVQAKKHLSVLLAVEYLFASCGVKQQGLPHKVLGMRPSDFVAWVDSHNYAEIFKMYREVLDKVIATVLSSTSSAVNNSSERAEKQKYIAQHFPHLAIIGNILPSQ